MIIDVSAALIFDGDNLLIAQRRADSHLGGLWEFPGGKREPNETDEACLVREIREELGVEIAVGELFEEVTHHYPGKSVHLKFFICKIIEGQPQPLDCAAIRWVTQESIGNYEFPAADQQLLDKLKQR
jgi:8-oxo-dGTP diphosphatase